MQYYQCREKASVLVNQSDTKFSDMNEQNTQVIQTQPPDNVILESKSHSRLIFVILIIGVIVLALGVIGFFWYRSKKTAIIAPIKNLAGQIIQPARKDTDHDGLPDEDERNQSKTDPAKDDTDGDGLSDGTEVRKFNTDPLKARSKDPNLTDKQWVYQNFIKKTK